MSQSSKPRLLICSRASTFVEDKVSSLQVEFEVQRATTAEMALFMARQWSPQICVVEGVEPFLGMTFQMRDQFSFAQMAIFVLAAEVIWVNEERAFRAGCDHYLPSNIEWRRLRARIGAALRRVHLAQIHSPALDLAADPVKTPKAFYFLGLEISPQDYLLRRGDSRVNVSPTQFRLLLAFINHPDQLLTRDWLKENVWEKSEISSRSIDAQISKLKRLIPELDPILINVYGRGYILSDPTKEKIAS